MINDKDKEYILSMLEGDDCLSALVGYSQKIFNLNNDLSEADYKTATLELLRHLITMNLISVYWANPSSDKSYDVMYEKAEQSHDEILVELEKRWNENGKLRTEPYTEVAFFTLSNEGEIELTRLRNLHL